MPTIEVRAVLLQRPGVDWQRQFAACQPYVQRHGYVIESIADDADAALALLGAGDVQVIVAAIDLPGDDELARRAKAAGGRLEHCRPPRQRRRVAEDPEVEIIRRMASRGGTVDEIVRLLGVPLERVRDILRRQR